MDKSIAEKEKQLFRTGQFGISDEIRQLSSKINQHTNKFGKGFSTIPTEEYEQIIRTIQRLLNERAQFDDLYKQAQERQDSTYQKINAYDAKVQELQDYISGLQNILYLSIGVKSNTQTRPEFEALLSGYLLKQKERISQLERDLAAEKLKLDHQLNLFTQQSAKISDLQSQVKKNEIDQINLKHCHHQELQALTKQLKSTELQQNESANLQKQLSIQKKEIDLLKSQLQKSSDQLNQQQQIQQKLKNEAERCQKVAAELQITNEQLKTDFQRGQKFIEKEKLTTMQLKDLERWNATFKSQIQKLERENQEMLRVKQQNAVITNENMELQKQITSFQENGVDSLLQRIKFLEEDQKKKQKEVETGNVVNLELKTEIQKLELEVEELKGENFNLGAKISGLAKQVEEGEQAKLQNYLLRQKLKDGEQE